MGLSLKKTPPRGSSLSHFQFSSDQFTILTIIDSIIVFSSYRFVLPKCKIICLRKELGRNN